MLLDSTMNHHTTCCPIISSSRLPRICRLRGTRCVTAAGLLLSLLPFKNIRSSLCGSSHRKSTRTPRRRIAKPAISISILVRSRCLRRTLSQPKAKSSRQSLLARLFINWTERPSFPWSKSLSPLLVRNRNDLMGNSQSLSESRLLLKKNRRNASPKSSAQSMLNPCLSPHASGSSKSLQASLRKKPTRRRQIASQQSSGSLLSQS